MLVCVYVHYLLDKVLKCCLLTWILLPGAGMLAVGVEIDCLQGDIYWTDAAHGVIKRAKSNGSDIENLVNGEWLSHFLVDCDNNIEL